MFRAWFLFSCVLLAACRPVLPLPPEEIVERSMRATAAAQSLRYRLMVSLSNPEKGIMTQGSREGEVQRESAQEYWTLTVQRSSINFLTVAPGETYVRFPQAPAPHPLAGEWWLLPEKNPSATQALDPVALPFLKRFLSITTPQAVPPLQGMYRLSVQLDAGALDPSFAAQGFIGTMLIDARTFLLRELQWETPPVPGENTVTLRVEFFDFNTIPPRRIPHDVAPLPPAFHATLRTTIDDLPQPLPLLLGIAELAGV